jgi:hypothetical protein
MELKGEKCVILYLEDWQIRMIKEFLGATCTNWHINIKDLAGVRKYRVNPDAKMKLKPMYLTGWQRREIKDQLGQDCDYIELTPDVITKYGVPAKDLLAITKKG